VRLSPLEISPQNVKIAFRGFRPATNECGSDLRELLITKETHSLVTLNDLQSLFHSLTTPAIDLNQLNSHGLMFIYD